jgi:hypothetical protein
VTRAAAADVLAPELEARFLDFTRACRSAVSGVSLYPAGHPAIRGALTRLVAAATACVSSGALTVSVQPEGLMVNGAHPTRADRAASELAELLHRHAVGRLVLHGAADPESWRALLLLLARTPEETRNEGGIAHLWSRAGAPSIEINEIDFAEVLREREEGEIGTLAAILSQAIKDGNRPRLSPEMAQVLAGILQDPDRIAQLWEGLSGEVATDSPEGVAGAFLEMARMLVAGATERDPERLRAVVEKLGSLSCRLPFDELRHLLQRRGTSSAQLGSVDLVDVLIGNLDPASAGSAIAQAISAEHAIERVARVVRTLMPDPDRRRQALADGKAAAAESGGSPAASDERWRALEDILSSPPDMTAVSEDYARELGAALDHDIDRLESDPPDRVAAWISSVSDTALRELDLQLLQDLLEVESDPSRWRENLGVLTAQIEHFMLVGHLDMALPLITAIARHTEDPSHHRPFAVEALEKLSGGPVMRQVVTHMRATDDAGFELMKRVCHSIGPAAITPLIEALAAEQHSRAQHRLRAVILGFGDRGREAAEQKLDASSWELRRVATSLLREFGGGKIVNLEALLTDAQPLVQREAVRTIALVGDEADHDLLIRTLLNRTAEVRKNLIDELVSMRDERAGQLFAHLVRKLPAHGALADLGLIAIEKVGLLGGPNAVPVLLEALNRGQWWAPLRTKKVRSAAAAALRRLGTSSALEALQQAALQGPGGVRAAAKSHLGAPARRPGGGTRHDHV